MPDPKKPSGISGPVMSMIMGPPIILGRQEQRLVMTPQLHPEGDEKAEAERQELRDSFKKQATNSIQP